MNSEDFNREFIAAKDSAYRYAITLLHDRHAAEDAVQDLYEKLWRRRILIRATGFRPLVMTSMRDMCLDRLRSQRRGGMRLDIAAADKRTSVAEYDAVENVELHTLVRRLVEALPQREREVMHLRDMEGMDIEQIAGITGSTEQSVRMALSRARCRVREGLLNIMNHGL